MSLAAVIVTDTSSSAITKAEAQALTDRIRGTAEQLWRLLLEAHERRVWQVLGYASWRHYATNEFEMSQSHVYRLLDHGRVVRALEAAADSPIGEIPENVARQIKPHLEHVTSNVRDRVQHGEEPQAAVSSAIADTRNYYGSSRTRADRSNRIIERIVADAEYITGCVEMVDYAKLDGSVVPTWAATLRKAAKDLTQLAARLERKAGVP